MASHVVGPLLVADRPLTEDERTTLDAEPTWGLFTLEPPFIPPEQPFTIGAQTTFRAQPKRSHGNQRGQVLTLQRAPVAPTATLPTRLTASPIPQGSGGSVTQPPDALLPDSYGYETYGYGPYGGEPL